MTPSEYIEDRIERIPFSGCWIWLLSTEKKGYGIMDFQCKRWLAHRFSFTTLVAPIPAGKLVCHRCDVPSCVNPNHLFLGTYSDNLKDAIKKGRRPDLSFNAKRWNITTINGIAKSQNGWARHIGISPGTLRYHLKRGATIQQLLEPTK